MFDIEYKGANAVIITTKKVRVVFDPNLSLVGMNNVSVKDSIEIATEARFTIKDSDAKLRINSPGEYEVGDVSIYGIAARRHIDTESQGKMATVYKITIGDTVGVILGNIEARLSDNQLEDIGVVDFVVIPVGGGGYTLNATEATGVVRQLNPKVVIPIHYADAAVNYEVPQDDIAEFIKELGVNVVETGARWRFKKMSDLPDSLAIIHISRT